MYQQACKAVIVPHALRGSSARVTQSVTGCIPTRERGNDLKQPLPVLHHCTAPTYSSPLAAKSAIGFGHPITEIAYAPSDVVGTYVPIRFMAAVFGTPMGVPGDPCRLTNLDRVRRPPTHPRSYGPAGNLLLPDLRTRQPQRHLPHHQRLVPARPGRL